MTNNEIMISVRYALHLKNAEVVSMIKSVGVQTKIYDVVNLLKNEDDEGFVVCQPEMLHAFLDGLILKRRGPSDAPAKKFSTAIINNNIVLRKLRIAFELKDTDILSILKSVGFTISKGELGALFRNRNHKNYIKCGDQIVRYFLKGLALKYRPNIG